MAAEYVAARQPSLPGPTPSPGKTIICGFFAECVSPFESQSAACGRWKPARRIDAFDEQRRANGSTAKEIGGAFTDGGFLTFEIDADASAGIGEQAHGFLDRP